MAGPPVATSAPTGISISCLPSLFRLASISQGVYKRGLDGNVSSPGALDRGTKARQLAEKAWALAEDGDVDKHPGECV